MLMNSYEIAVLYHPDLEIDLDKPKAKFTKIITDNGGKIVSEDALGKRKLAYIIKKQEYAVYVIYSVELPAENVNKVEQTLNITDEVIRFLIVKPDTKAIAKAEAFKAKQAARKRPETPEAPAEEAKTEE